MDIPALRQWLAEPRSQLAAAVAEGVRAHVSELRSRRVRFYGYALLPGEPYDIHNIVAVTNCEADIVVPRTDKRYRYYRYSVDEWKHWHHKMFAAANAQLAEANERFESMHVKEKGNSILDEFQVAHADALLDGVARGLGAAKYAGAFGAEDPFLVVWISDSGHPIIVRSAHRLNSEAVAQEFVGELG
jgi:hypothetical protein